jgi:hypothetical protein
VKKENFFYEMRREHRTRQADNPLNMAKRGAKIDTRLYSYSVRLAEKWNSLQDLLKNMEKVDTFKRAPCEVNAYEN